MSDLIRNPPDMDAALLAGLNAAFGRWGTQRDFDWCFKRKRNGRAADLIAITEDGAAVAGSAVTYARLESPDGGTVPLACMTGAWTLPGFRGRGYLARIAAESRAIAHERGCVLLIAFVTVENPSARILMRAGAHSMATGYHRAAAGGDGTAMPVTATPELAWSMRGARADAIRFGYSEDEWRTQFIDRPASVELLRLPGGAVAIVEQKNGFDRLLDLFVPEGESRDSAILHMRSVSAARGRTLFIFSADAATSALLQASGFETIPGMVLAFPLGPVAGGPFADTPWPFGPWRIANGDRM